MTALRVVIAADDPLLRSELDLLLSDEEDMIVVALCAQRAELAAAVATREPAVVVTSAGMVGALLDRPPAAGVVLLARALDRSRLVGFLAGGEGGRGYVVSRSSTVPEGLPAVVRSVAEGELYVDPKVVESLLESRAADSTSALHRLSPRERSVLEGVAGGGSNLTIGRALWVSHAAVAQHALSALEKLGLPRGKGPRQRTAAVIAYLLEK